jgi:hypothetical protein
MWLASILTCAIFIHNTFTTAAAPAKRWRGVHIMAPNPEDLPLLQRAITEVLVPLGVNVLVMEVDYKFAYQSHPELRMEPVLHKADIRDLAALCRKHGIRLIPQFQCLGHQSWAQSTFSLLTKYPELDETPQIPKNNPNIYCRSWCPLHPRVNEIVFALMDELIDAFQAEAFHVGMDEVFLIGSEQCPRCKGKNPAELFAKAVNDYHQHLVKEKKLTMLMWGDRLLDADVMNYGEWEASKNGTAPAIDLIPKDIVICDWHYGLRESYPSLPFFHQKGFRVLPSSWKDAKAAVALRQDAERHGGEKMLGHLCTTWVNGADFARALLGEGEASRDAQQAAQALRVCFEK